MEDKMTLRFRYCLASLIFAVAVSGGAYSQQKNKDQRAAAPSKTDSADENKSAELKKKKTILSQKSIVATMMDSGYDIKKTLIDYRGINSGLLMYEAKYDTYFFGSGLTMKSAAPDSRGSFFQGTSITAQNITVGFEQGFETGTAMRAMLGSTASNMKGAALGGGMGYQTALSVQIAQELLKNCFGLTDRLTKKKIANLTKIGRDVTRMKLAGVLIEAVVGYYNSAIADENLKTAEIGLKSTTDIKNLIERKQNLGLSEPEEVMDWSGRVLIGKNNLERAKKYVFDSKQNMITMLNLKAEVDDIEIDRALVTDAPSISVSQALADAYAKRVDWNATKILLKNAEMDYDIASNETLPSFKLKLGAGLKDASTSSFSNTFQFTHPEYSAGFEVVYPLGNHLADTKLRDARLALKKEKINTESMEKKIRDEVVSIVKQCEVDYTIYQQTKKAREYFQNCYNQMLVKFGRGQYNSLYIKQALDGYMAARQGELMALVAYNVSLLKRDVARNVIFENLNVDIDTLLKRAEN
jgi:outer membrane protein TolC